MEFIGRKVYVKELGEEGEIVAANKNWAGEMVYKVKTKSFERWSCYLGDMNFI